MVMGVGRIGWDGRIWGCGLRWPGRVADPKDEHGRTWTGWTGWTIQTVGAVWDDRLQIVRGIDPRVGRGGRVGRWGCGQAELARVADPKGD